MSDDKVNFGYGIPEYTAVPWVHEHKPIRHYVLTVQSREDPKERRRREREKNHQGADDCEGNSVQDAVVALRHLHFEARQRVNEDLVSGLGHMTDYARRYLPPELPRGVGESPLDMGVEEQCWLLVQLDPAINWQFAKGEFPCTLKEPDLTGRNMLLRHVYDDKTDYSGPVKEDGCKTMFFAVAQRDKKDTSEPYGAWRCFVNFNVEFIQTDNDPKTNEQKTTRLKLIIDPDVPNEGPDSIP